MDQYPAWDERTGAGANAGAGIAAPSVPALLRDAFLDLEASVDRLAAGDPAQPSRDVVVQYLDALELAIARCLSRPRLGCWLDVLCPLKENLRSLRAYAGSADLAEVDPALVTAAVVVTQLVLSLARQPEELLICEVLLDVMAAPVWSWPLPPAARSALRCGFGHSALPCEAAPRDAQRAACAA